MNVFDIVGPIMIGPSSSHTAGAVKIGRVIRALLGEKPAHVVVKFHGSFAKTYKGHGTDKAIIAGMMNMLPDDRRIKTSLALALEANICYSFETVTLEGAHPNTALVTATSKDGSTVSIQGASVGGGNIMINKIDDLEVQFTGKYNTLIIYHTDAPGAIASISNLLARNDVNIASMKVYRSFRGGDAIMIIEMDQDISQALNLSIQELHEIQGSTLIKSI